MNTCTRASVALAAFFSLVSAVAPPAASGQGQSERPIFLALPQEFPDVDARAVLMREPGRDIVILREDDAGPETLSVALGVLRRMTRDHPLDGRGQLVPIAGYASREAMSPDHRAALEFALADLRQRPLSNVGNLGPGRWMRYEER